MSLKVTAVIMAGGKGERFWPKSRKNYPKQFLSLTDDGFTMIQHTANRLKSIVKDEDIYVVTNSDYVDLVMKQLPQIPKENILAEPVARNTAPCIGFAAVAIGRKYEDAVMMVLPSDHLIKSEEIYADTMQQAVNAASIGNNLVTIGIMPTYPETGYGYINFTHEENSEIKCDGVYAVKRFVEKPNLNTAKEYIASGQYLWNSGMFVWKLSTIMNAFKLLMPETYHGLCKIKEAFFTSEYEKILSETFEKFQSESIDFGIMEKSEHIYTIPGSFGWDDVGSWLALERVNQSNDLGNVIQGDVITVDAHNNIVIGGNRLIATVGLKDTVVVDTEDALLICPRESTQDIKKIIEVLKISDRDDLL